MDVSPKREWLLLIHQLPPKPDYFRVKIWRRLQKIVATAIKQSVYVLPDTAKAYEDLHWIVKEITGGGGTASLSRAVFVEGLSDSDIMTLFCKARSLEYEKIAADARCLNPDTTESQSVISGTSASCRKEIARLRTRLTETTAIDFFHADGRDTAEQAIADWEMLLKKSEAPLSSRGRQFHIVSGSTWVSRRNLFVDRIACAWLIRRFIDQNCRFKFVGDDNYPPNS